MGATGATWRDERPLDRYAWPGGYPLYYLLADGEAICGNCANGWSGSEASTDPETATQWRIVDRDVNWEATDLLCSHCGQRIESVYAEEDEEA